MKSHDLAKILLENPNLDVHLSYGAGDFWQTTLAPQVERVKIGPVIHSEYHRMPVVRDEDDYNDGKDVILLS